MKKLFLSFIILSFSNILWAQQPVPQKPRIIISTDIGGTDPDDNQSMTHFLMYSDLFQTEGLISSPSYGDGTKKHIIDMVDLYEKDLPKLQQHASGFPSAAYLRSISKQGRHGAAPYKGYASATEGSNWIISCAKKKSAQALWILVWGGLEDVAQALHDAPEIQKNIKIYWIGGPNKKWSANSYAYIAANFPDLFFIEANTSYYGFFANNKTPDSLNNNLYSKLSIREAGFLGKDFNQYYKGQIKMGDTPSLLYMMDGNPDNPLKESWGGSFVPFKQSPRVIFTRNTNLQDTVAVCSVIEYHFKGPEINIHPDSACFTMTVSAKIGVQKWAGYYLGKGEYVIRYCPKQAESFNYSIASDIPNFPTHQGQMVVSNHWPGKPNTSDYRLGKNWYTDKPDIDLYNEQWQGAKTVQKWRNIALLDWTKRWEWLR